MSQTVRPQIEASWKNVLQEEFNADYFTRLKMFLQQEKKEHLVYPPGKEIFEAFNRTAFAKVKIVILGQDPYHGPGQAHGLCFSVRRGVLPPPSLINIFRELESDCGAKVPDHGDLSAWADQGVLLLNATLTVRARNAGSHQNKGWETFTDAVIKQLSSQREHLVFMLWGRYAKNKASMISEAKHCILTAAHPSPYSADKGFFGCRHFSKANDYLIEHGIEAVEWGL